MQTKSKITPINIALLKYSTAGYRDTKNLSLIEEFLFMDIPAAEIDVSEYKNATIAANSIKKSADRFGYKAVKIVTRKDKVYMINKNLVPEELKQYFKV